MNKELIIWCVCCWERHTILNPYIYKCKNDKCVLQGTCSICGSKMSRMLPNEYSCRSVDYVIEQLTNKQNNV